MNDLDKYHELAFYTLSLNDKAFIHQHVVDAYGAQNADANTKAIALFFSLAGLYLLAEKNYSGRQIQKAHQTMAAKTKDFVKIDPPQNKGDITIEHVLNEPAGDKRNAKIIQWCKSVWSAYADEHGRVMEATDNLLF